MDSEYPEVNGALSQTCYLRALDDCYTRFKTKNLSLHNFKPTVMGTDYFLFHSPYNKLVQKSFARLVYLDVLDGSIPIDASTEMLAKWLTIPAENTYDVCMCMCVCMYVSACVFMYVCMSFFSPVIKCALNLYK